MSKLIKMPLLILALIAGAFMFIYGGYDDSPGAQGLGAMAVIAGAAGLAKMKKG